MTAYAIVYSDDNAVTWTAVTSPFDDFGVVNGIAYNGSVFVAVGYIWVYTSTDPDDFQSGTYVQHACVATSSDGATWTQRTSTITEGYLSGVVWNGIYFVSSGAVGGAVVSEHSTTGTTWTAGTVPGGLTPPDYGQAITVNSATVVCAYTEGTLAWPLVSTDGLTFVSGADGGSFSGSANDIAYGSSHYVLTSFAHVYSATDPSAGPWSSASTGFTSAFTVTFAAFGNSKWFAGNGDTLLSSTNATAWSSQTISAFASGAMTKLLYNSSRYILIGGTCGAGGFDGFGQAIVARSPDLVTWTGVTMAANTPALYAIALGGSRLVAGGQPNNTYSPPGVPTSQACGPD